jgi:6-oxo-cyclohex-1-ene-carbonyl-CoA hydrolase
MTTPFEFHDHDLGPRAASEGKVKYELRPAITPSGKVAEGLYSAWIILDNPSQYNSYTTDMVKDVILSFRRASNAQDVVAVVFTGAGDRAFCTGGNTKEYAEYYAGRPGEYARYMRLFNDMVTGILLCDKPVICRVNGMRIGGGQEIGMACDFSVASDLANFGQAGPKHGSAPDGGATDFLPLFTGVESAMVSCTLCQPWTAYQALRVGLITEALPALRVDGAFVPNPLVVTDRWVDEGRIVYGEMKKGEALAGKSPDGEGRARPREPRRRRREDGHFAADDDACLHLQDHRVHPQAQARSLGQEQRDKPRLARPQHDDRGERRVPRLQRGHQGEP